MRNISRNLLKLYIIVMKIRTIVGEGFMEGRMATKEVKSNSSWRELQTPHNWHIGASIT